MSSFSVTANHTLRMIYAGNTDIMKRNDRADKPAAKLNIADSTALKKGLNALKNYNTKEADDSNEYQKTKFYNQVKAFSDAYNNTLESGTGSQNSSISKLTDKLKQVSRKYADKLSEYGITFDSKGYMSVRKSAVDNIAISKYDKIVGSESDYNKELTDIASKLSKHIDLAL